MYICHYNSNENIKGVNVNNLCEVSPEDADSIPLTSLCYRHIFFGRLFFKVGNGVLQKKMTLSKQGMLHA